MTLGEVLRRSTEYLERKGVDSPRLDAELLLSHALGLSRLELYTQHDRPLTESERDGARALLERRGKREPLAYVLGEWGFHKLTLKTDARALVPRPETEVVVERALARIAGVDAPRVLDVGTGTGAIALVVKHERPDARVVATDISADALALARENAARLDLDVDFVQADLVVDGRFDLVVSNPPYVLRDEELPLELAFEPTEALYDDGQTAALAAAAKRVLDGWLVVETHSMRAALVMAALDGYEDVTVTADLAGKDRVVEGRWTR